MGFSEFIRERQYLTNVSLSTLHWYKYSLKWLDTESPTQDDLKAAVLKMRAKGLRATGCNSAIRAINAYVHWASAGPDVKCSPACRHPKIAELKEPQNVLPTFTDKQVRLLVEWKAKGRLERRLHLILLFLFDTGARIGEVLKLRVCDINLDDLLVTLDGKGSKQRVVPISFELRKASRSDPRKRAVFRCSIRLCGELKPAILPDEIHALSTPRTRQNPATPGTVGVLFIVQGHEHHRFNLTGKSGTAKQSITAKVTVLALLFGRSHCCQHSHVVARGNSSFAERISPSAPLPSLITGRQRAAVFNDKEGRLVVISDTRNNHVRCFS